MAQINWSEIIKSMQTQMARAAAVTSDGGYVVAGDGQDPSTPRRGVIAKVTAKTGLGIAWNKSYGGKFDNLFRGVTELKDGSLVATGISFYSGYSGDEDIWVVKMDKDGNILTENTYGTKGEQDDGYAVTATPDGGFIVCGLALSNNSPSIWVLKFDSNCTLMWDKKFAGKIAFNIINTTDGGYILSGGSSINGGFNSNVYVIKLDADGNKVWDKVYSQQVYVMLHSGITETADNGYVVVGKQFVMKIDKNGELMWDQGYPACFLNSVVEMPDGKLFAGGSALDNYSTDHAYFLAMNAAGDKIWDNTSLLPAGFTISVLSGNEGAYVGAGTLPQDRLNYNMFVSELRPTS